MFAHHRINSRRHTSHTSFHGFARIMCLCCIMYLFCMLPFSSSHTLYSFLGVAATFE